ncbi:MAG: acyltransferase [Geobacteraceae bacterium]|nr:acyltransferase [Geobacteraceae bacterium]
MLKKLYLSPLGIVISAVMNLLGVLQRPFMVYGFLNRCTNRFNKYTRISSTAVIIDKKQLDIADHTWVWHHSILDASNGISIGKGCQIGAWVGIFTHGSHLAVRLLGEKYIYFEKDERIGYQRGPVSIGEYTFVGANALIMPGVSIGKGCLIGAGAIVSKSIPDYSIVSGNPAEIIGDTRKLDRKYFKNELVQKNYYDPSVIEIWLAERTAKAAGESPSEA